MRLLIHDRCWQRIATPARAVAPGLEVLVLDENGRFTLDGAPADPASAPADLAFASTDVFQHGPVRDFMIACLKSPDLTWFQSGAAGFDHPVFATLADKGLTLTNSDASAVAIAEFVLARVLEGFHGDGRRREAQAAQRWEKSGFREIHGSHWLIVGMGRIGGEIARRAQAFGARVTGVRRHPDGSEPADRMLRPAELPDALPDADVIVLAAGANRDSEGLVDTAFLSALKDDAVLVNIARGALVDEAALLAGLDDGRPATAILDVFANEPLPADNPLWTHRRVRLSAHCAAYGSGFAARGDRVFLDNLARFVAGEPLANQVDAVALAASVPGNR